MTAFDMTDSIAPRSDQINAEDLLTGPRTVTITEVRIVGGEQPVEIVTAEFGPGRPFKPSKTVRRILVNAWEADARKYAGRRMTLYRDPSVKWGGMDVGGIRVSHLSHIDKRITLALTVTKGKRAAYVVDPLPDTAPTVAGITPEQIARLTESLTAAGIERDARLDYCRNVVGRPVTKPGDLTYDEAAKVLSALADMIDPPPLAGPDDDALPLGDGAE